VIVALLGLLPVILGAIAVVLLRQLQRTASQLRRELSVHQLLALFGPAAAAVQGDPRQLLVWQPIARTSRQLFPEAFAELDQASGGSFPFTREQLQAAHARCSSDWLGWERAHDAEYALKTAMVQEEIARIGGQPTPLLKTRLAAIEQEKLERYQQRYEDYIKTAKALAAFVE
jgi:hypothetical protein